MCRLLEQEFRICVQGCVHRDPYRCCCFRRIFGRRSFLCKYACKRILRVHACTSKCSEGVRPFGLWLCGEFGEGVERSVDKGGYLVDWGKNSTRFWTFFPFPSHRKIVEKLTKSEIENLYLHVPCKYFNISSEFSERRGDPWIVKDVEKRKITTSLFSRTVGHRRAKTRASRERNPG